LTLTYAFLDVGKIGEKYEKLHKKIKKWKEGEWKKHWNWKKLLDYLQKPQAIKTTAERMMDMGDTTI
jgi:hypothetical protein